MCVCMYIMKGQTGNNCMKSEYIFINPEYIVITRNINVNLEYIKTIKSYHENHNDTGMVFKMSLDIGSF